MNNLSTYKIFNDNMSTFKDTSLDKHNKNEKSLYMTESTLSVVNFDDVKDEYIKELRLKETPKSNDALYFDNFGNVIFVEFKNGYMDKVKQFGVRKKIYDSSLIFTDIVGIGISKMRQYVEYILVYNEKTNPETIEEKEKYVQNSPSFDNIAKAIRGFGKEEYIGFGIDIFKNYCFKDVHTYTEAEFEKFLKQLSM